MNKHDSNRQDSINKSSVNHPLIISKDRLRELFGLSYTRELRKYIFTDEVLKIMGWTYKGNYRNKRFFNVTDTKLIFSTLKELGIRFKDHE